MIAQRMSAGLAEGDKHAGEDVNFGMFKEQEEEIAQRRKKGCHQQDCTGALEGDSQRSALQPAVRRGVQAMNEARAEHDRHGVVEPTANSSVPPPKRLEQSYPIGDPIPHSHIFAAMFLTVGVLFVSFVIADVKYCSDLAMVLSMFVTGRCSYIVIEASALSMEQFELYSGPFSASRYRSV
jgi:hypothetical protein